MSSTSTTAWLDEQDREVAGTIREHGLYIEYVKGCACGECGEAPPFAYSVGLFGLGHPELLIFGVPPVTAAGVINHLFARVRAGADLVPGELVVFDKWPQRIVVEEVPNAGEIVFAANRHHGRPDEDSVPVFQLTWDDVDARFPWDDGYSVAPSVQPRPGTFRR
ncbi:MAG: DUF4262 domain-containing protein [Mycobacteriaceae bacterium]